MDITVINQAKTENWMVCVYGLGYLGKRLYKEIPSIFGLSANYYSDGSDDKVDNVILPEMTGIYKDELLKIKEPVLVFILVDDPYDIEIQKNLSLNVKLHTITLRELTQMKEVIIYFYGNKFYAEYICLPDNSV